MHAVIVLTFKLQKIAACALELFKPGYMLNYTLTDNQLQVAVVNEECTVQQAVYAISAIHNNAQPCLFIAVSCAMLCAVTCTLSKWTSIGGFAEQCCSCASSTGISGTYWW